LGEQDGVERLKRGNLYSRVGSDRGNMDGIRNLNSLNSAGGVAEPVLHPTSS